MPLPALDPAERARIGRYIVNGIVATIVHFGTLFLLREVVGVRLAGVANFLAACLGITVSFVGGRHYVFRDTATPWTKQIPPFLALYASIAVLHGLVLFGWTDVMGFDYRIGFVLASGIQVALTYIGNKHLVFTS